MLMQHTGKLFCKFIVTSTRLLLHGMPPRLTQGDWHIQSITHHERQCAGLHQLFQGILFRESNHDFTLTTRRSLWRSSTAGWCAWHRYWYTTLCTFSLATLSPSMAV